MNDVDALVIGGGQSGLAAARALRRAGRVPVILESGPEPVGSWPSYYDSLVLFSPARYSALPEVAFPGDPDHYPHRDEVVDYLRGYAKGLDVDIRVGHRAEQVHRQGTRFHVDLHNGESMTAPLVVAATGAFGRPHRPELPGLDSFTGSVLHASDYREPTAFDGTRVVVVGAANSAVQIAVELAGHARVSLATRRPVTFAPQLIAGRDVHFWSVASGFDHLPIGHLVRNPPPMPVNDDGHYRRVIDEGNPDRRPMFTAVDGRRITWADGTRERVDTIILATGYRPELSYLEPLGALDGDGTPRQRRGVSTTHPGLGYVGLEWQRSFASATLRGVGRDARYVTRRLLRG
ncbi:putative flavoprotein involved in K+ transport [Prauserella sediminis]|uniref:Putative flavoprotein involved in K+ transport n=1 Tax=Prauserella sediminis TaxID=577680 RepID=A0A839XIN7_9PSEU|nr:NAD(P)/FAD-dependent oxidoreductase [Prauserella sediminis]MBB3661619.1 putative flavoprotein involved in K+ transport [Prauserella sediminis]